MMRRVWLAALWCAAAQAAVISGVVLDRSTGRPLARSQVSLQPVDGTAGKSQATRANRGGQFRFVVDAGMYLLRATRAGFAPFQFGQREWKSAGKPMAVEQDGTLYLDIRLRRYGAISGTLLDENEIGIPDQKVVAYQAKLPLRIAASAISDDRGIYRIHGLEPGTYHVRSAAELLEDGSGLLPTFHKETMQVDQSITVDVDLDQQADEVDIRPLPGKLFRVSGRVVVSPTIPVTVTLVSDVGRSQRTTPREFAFDRLAPGHYELIAEADDPYGHGKLGFYQEFDWDTDRDIQVPLNSWRETGFQMLDEKGNKLDVDSAKVNVRRKDLDGGGHAEILKIERGHAALGPGRWEMWAIPPAGYYAMSISGGYGLPDSQSGRADGWIEVLLHGFDTVAIKVSARPAGIHGTVGASSDPIPGAPVYLEAFDTDNRKRLGELHVTRTDVHGRYHFSGLAPGVYRVLSTFEYENPEPESMEAAGARSVTLSEATDTAQDLDLYVP
jgi:hypothetical protein